MPEACIDGILWVNVLHMHIYTCMHTCVSQVCLSTKCYSRHCHRYHLCCRYHHHHHLGHHKRPRHKHCHCHTYSQFHLPCLFNTSDGSFVARCEFFFQSVLWVMHIYMRRIQFSCNARTAARCPTVIDMCLP